MVHEHPAVQMQLSNFEIQHWCLTAHMGHCGPSSVVRALQNTWHSQSGAAAHPVKVVEFVGDGAAVEGPVTVGQQLAQLLCRHQACHTTQFGLIRTNFASSSEATIVVDRVCSGPWDTISRRRRRSASWGPAKRDGCKKPVAFSGGRVSRC